MAKKTLTHVSISAWNKSLKDIENRFKKLEKSIKSISLDSVDKKIKNLDNRVDKKVSNSAWQTTLVDLDKRMDKIEKLLEQKSPKVESIETLKKQIHELDERVDEKVGHKAWQTVVVEFENRLDKLEDAVKKPGKVTGLDSIRKQITELDARIDQKVSNKAWERALVSLDKQFKDLALKELEQLDDRLDKTFELINQLTANLGKKVNVAAWDRLCVSNEQLTDRVDALSNKSDRVMEKLMEIESIINEAKVSERELKKLLESI
jgi:hypothetical protein